MAGGDGLGDGGGVVVVVAGSRAEISDRKILGGERGVLDAGEDFCGSGLGYGRVSGLGSGDGEAGERE